MDCFDARLAMRRVVPLAHLLDEAGVLFRTFPVYGSHELPSFLLAFGQATGGMFAGDGCLFPPSDIFVQYFKNSLHCCFHAFLPRYSRQRILPSIVYGGC
jgi:hypothetical protein